MAQVAAVIGRQFSWALLEVISTKHAVELEKALDKLVAADIVFPDGRRLDRGYSFKHALVRDAAYESLLLSRRREFGAERVARALEQRFPETLANEPELLAHTFHRRRLGAARVRLSHAGGRPGDEPVRYKEAVAHFSAGLRVTDGIANSTDRMRRQLGFLLKLGIAQTPISGPQSVEVEETYRRAGDSARHWIDSRILQSEMGAVARRQSGPQDHAGPQRGPKMVTLAERSGDGDLLLEAHHCRWSTAFFGGDVAATLNECRIGAQTYDLDRHRHLGLTYGGHDPGVCAHGVNARGWHCACAAMPKRRRPRPNARWRSRTCSIIPIASPTP